MKEIDIIPLAEKKMERRGILKGRVADALRNAEQVVGGHGGRSVAQQRRRIRRKEMLLRLVFEETDDSYVADIKWYWKKKSP